MKNEYTIRATVPEDIKYLASVLRQGDIDELRASHGGSTRQAMWGAYLVSRDTTFTGEANGVPVCVYGVREPCMLNTVASPWMLASRDLVLHSGEFLRRSKQMVEIFRNIFPVMENYVDARNIASIRWLQWVGFSVYYPKPYGVEGLPFHRFDMRS